MIYIYTSLSDKQTHQTLDIVLSSDAIFVENISY